MITKTMIKNNNENKLEYYIYGSAMWLFCQKGLKQQGRELRTTAAGL